MLSTSFNRLLSSLEYTWFTPALLTSRPRENMLKKLKGWNEGLCM